MREWHKSIIVVGLTLILAFHVGFGSLFAQEPVGRAPLMNEGCHGDSDGHGEKIATTGIRIVPRPNPVNKGQ